MIDSSKNKEPVWAKYITEENLPTEDLKWLCEIIGLEATKKLIDTMVDDDTSLLTILVGEDVKPEEKDEVYNYVSEKYSDIDIDIRDGGQPVYSFLVGAE